MDVIDFIEKYDTGALSRYMWGVPDRETGFLKKFYNLDNDSQEKVINRFWYKCETYKSQESIDKLAYEMGMYIASLYADMIERDYENNDLEL